ncbi:MULTISPECIES: hypothetical protein [unclassified Rhizobium]|uniref:hypothetical protein n=1 Tax=unclassified Rhizobium TaxID=2613769 RepID=UPI000DBA6E2A|nr:hypothetical protein [Rhizobium sp. AN80A]
MPYQPLYHWRRTKLTVLPTGQPEADIIDDRHRRKIRAPDAAERDEARTWVSLSLYEIGPPLGGQGISQDAIVKALYAIKDEGVIDLPSGNRLVLLKPLT